MWPHSANRTTYILELFHYSEKTFKIINQKIDGPDFDFTENHTFIFIWLFKKYYCLKSFLSLELSYAVGIILWTQRTMEFNRVLQNCPKLAMTETYCMPRMKNIHGAIWRKPAQGSEQVMTPNASITQPEEEMLTKKVGGVCPRQSSCRYNYGVIALFWFHKAWLM